MKIYLGDGVYAQSEDEGTIILTTEDGRPNHYSNKIVLEPEVLDALDAFRRKNLITAIKELVRVVESRFEGLEIVALVPGELSKAVQAVKLEL